MWLKRNESESGSPCRLHMMATEDNWEEIIRSNYTELLKNITTEYGLFGELKKSRIFTPIALKTLMDCKDTTEKIDRMLRNLQKKDFDSFMKFCDALNNSDQNHIVKNYLSKVQDVTCRQVTATDSASNEDSSHYRSITEGMSECLKQHWNDIIAELNFDEGLLSQIDRLKIVTRLQLNKLRDIDAESRRTEHMLCWLERGSEKQFNDFCEALRANSQSHLVHEYLSPVTEIPERRIAKVYPQVMEKTPEQPIEVRKVPEGGSHPNPVPAEVTVKDIKFSACSPEFLTDLQAKVIKKVAYRCESKPRGRALIMNNMYFSGDRLSLRDGSDVDTDNLEALFNSLNFSTVIRSNRDAKEMWDILVQESKESYHKNYDMFVLFLMSHGIKGEIYGMDGKSIKTEDVMRLFNGENCPGLLDKPKLFFIQSCQGNIKTMGVIATDGDTTESDSVQYRDATMAKMTRNLSLADDFNLSIPLPPPPEFQSDAVADDRVHEMADMAIIYATVGGHVAWRRKDTGSLFVQCLINVLTKRAHETDLMRMITEAFNMLHDLEMVEGQKRYKQIGEKRDTLRREVYLLPH